MTQQLATILEQLAAAAGDVTVDLVKGVTEYRRGGQLIAVLDDSDAIELRLMPDVAEAARRTPSTSPSKRGDEWVHFAPSDRDEHARDRLEAWFRVAWRLAGDADSGK